MDIAVESSSALQRMRQGIQLSASEVTQIFRRIYDRASRALRATSCCTSDVVTTMAGEPPHYRPAAPRAPSSRYAHMTSSATFSESPHMVQTWPWRPEGWVPGTSSQSPAFVSQHQFPPPRPPQPYVGTSSSQRRSTSASRAHSDAGASSSQSPYTAPGTSSFNS